MTDAKKNPDAATSGLKDRTPSKENNLMTKNTRIDEATRAHYAQLLADFLPLPEETKREHPLTTEWNGRTPGWADTATVDISEDAADMAVSFAVRDELTGVSITRFAVFSLLTGDLVSSNDTAWWSRLDEPGDDPNASEAVAAARALLALSARIDAEETGK